jgi:hypothetical protein
VASKEFKVGDIVYEINSTFHKRGTIVQIFYDRDNRACCVVRFVEGAEQTFRDFELARDSN